MEWISVKDRLPINPEDFSGKDSPRYRVKEVIVTDGVTVFPCDFRAGHSLEFWCGFDSFYECNVTHWMPLPNPPKEE